MSYMKNDINFNLMFLIGVVIAATILLTLYYTHSLGSANVDYDELTNECTSILDNLTATTACLNQCDATKTNISLEFTESKKIEEKSREEFNQIYEQTEKELTETEKILKVTKDDLTATKSSLADTMDELNTKKVALAKAEKEIESLETYKAKYDNLEDDVKHCQDDDPTVSCLNAINT